MRIGAVVGATAALAVFSYAGLIGSTPGSIVMFLPLVWEGTDLAVLLGPALFLLWSVDLLTGRERLPVRSIVLALVFASCSAAWLVLGWSFGVKWQGAGYVITMATINLGTLILLLVWAVQLRKQPDWWRAFTYNCVLFAWPLLFGFPWLGETP
jgi:hypothetical protein